MTTMCEDDLAIPAFLKRQPGEVKPEVKTRRAKVKARKPEGERYEDAERWEVFIESTETFLRKLACGQRKLWAAEDETGARWVWLHDGETEQRVSMEAWQRMANKGRRIA